MTAEHVIVVTSSHGAWVFLDPYEAAVRAAMENGYGVRTETIEVGDKVPGVVGVGRGDEQIDDFVSDIDGVLDSIERARKVLDETHSMVQELASGINDLRTGDA